MNTYKKSELKLIHKMSKYLVKDSWDIYSVKKCYQHFITFIKSISVDEASILRYGENFIKSEIKDLSQIDCIEAKNLIIRMCAEDTLEIPVLISCIGFILKLTIANYEGAIDYSTILKKDKEEN